MNEAPSVNRNCTTAMIGISSRNAMMRCGYSSMIASSGISPNAKPTTAALVEAIGSTILGNWIWRISDPAPVTEVVASLMLLENHFQGRIAASTNSG